MTHLTLEDIAAVVENPKIRDTENGRVLRCGCPAHGGHDQNCSISFGNDGKPLAKCFSQDCDYADIRAVLEERLGRPLEEHEGGQSVHITVGGRKVGAEVSVPPENVVKDAQRRSVGRKTWDIRDATGQLIAHHVRTDYSDGSKKVIWKRPGGEWNLGDMGTADLPLYGAPEITGMPEGAVVVTEGEKAADAVRLLGMLSAGTVTGSSGTPGIEALEVLRDREVILWPDNDEKGFAHMKRIGESLLGVASSVRWFEWTEAPRTGDAADHPGSLNGGRQALREALLAAPAFGSDGARAEGSHFRRMDLGEIMLNPPPPPDMLIRDILYPGRVHCMFSEGGMGKTFFALWLSNRVMEKGGKVLFCDNENGWRLIAERLKDLGADASVVSKSLLYYPFPDTPISPSATAEFEVLLDTEVPDLVVFDSWINFLAGAGLDENSSVDIAAWGSAYTQQARRREIACLILDHPGKDRDSEPRGSSRKGQYVDVNLQFLRPQYFDRDTIGRIEVRVTKDREGWLPMGSAFRFGGDGNKLICERTSFDSAIAVGNSILASDRTVLNALESFGATGAIDKIWKAEAMKRGVSKATYYRSKTILLDEDFVSRDSENYYANTASFRRERESEKGEVSRGLIESHGEMRPENTTPSEARSHEVSSPLGGDESSPVRLASSEAGLPTVSGLIETARLEIRVVDGEDRIFVHPEDVSRSEGKFIRANQSEFVKELRRRGI